MVIESFYCSVLSRTSNKQADLQVFFSLSFFRSMRKNCYTFVKKKIDLFSKF